MSDVGKRTAVDKGRISFERLGDIGQEGLAQQQGHGTCSTDVAGLDGMAFRGRADHDFTETSTKVGIVGCEDKNGHHFTGRRDVKSVLTYVAVRWTSHADDHGAEGAVVHVDDSGPRDARGVEFCLVAVFDVVVNECREQVVCRGDGVQVPR